MFSGRESTPVTVRCRKYRAQALVDSVNQAQGACLDIVLACRPCFVKRIVWGRKNGSHLLAGETQYRDSSKSNSNGLPRFGVGDEGTSRPALAPEFNISLSTVHGYIE
jgi:hypothetical protein